MAIPNIRKHKRQTITLSDKELIIEVSKTKSKVSDLVTHFNGESTIRTTLKSKDELLWRWSRRETIDCKASEASRIGRSVFDLVERRAKRERCRWSKARSSLRVVRRLPLSRANEEFGPSADHSIHVCQKVESASYHSIFHLMFVKFTVLLLFVQYLQ